MFVQAIFIRHLGEVNKNLGECYLGFLIVTRTEVLLECLGL